MCLLGLCCLGMAMMGAGVAKGDGLTRSHIGKRETQPPPNLYPSVCLVVVSIHYFEQRGSSGEYAPQGLLEVTLQEQPIGVEYTQLATRVRQIALEGFWVTEGEHYVTPSQIHKITVADNTCSY